MPKSVMNYTSKMALIENWFDIQVTCVNLETLLALLPTRKKFQQWTNKLQENRLNL